MLVASSVAVITLLIGSVIGCERSQCRQATAFVECRKKFEVVVGARTEAETANVIDAAGTAPASMRERLSLAERKTILERALPASLLVFDDMVDKELFATTVALHNKQLSHISKQLSDHNKQLSDINTTFNKQLSDIKKQIFDHSKQLSDIKKQIFDHSKQISDIKKQISDINKELQELRSLIVRQFRRRNETGETKRLNGI